MFCILLGIEMSTICRPLHFNVGTFSIFFRYVDVILQLIDKAGDFVSDDIWFRVVQFVMNNDDLQVIKCSLEPFYTLLLMYFILLSETLCC